MAKKLWQKFLIGGAATTSIFAAIGGGLYAFSKSNLSKGEPHYSQDPTKVELSKFQNIKEYKVSFRDPIDTKVVIGEYKINFETKNGKQVLGEGTVDGKAANQWVEDYYKANKQPPVMYVFAGGVIKFINFYTDVILPRDFIKFIEWFSNYVPWDPSIATLSSFVIKRGIEIERGGVILGSYTNTKGEKKAIKFMPDSFYGEIAAEYFIGKFNKKPLTKKEVKRLIEVINQENKATKENHAKIFPYSVEKVEGEKDQYNLFVSYGGFSVIKGFNKLYSNHTVVSDIDINVDEEGHTTISDRQSNKVVESSKITRLSILRAFASKSKWKGLGFNFLKSVTIHEYGHMQTLTMAASSSNNPVSMGASGNVSPNSGAPAQQTDIKVLNQYLAARIPHLKAVNVSPILKKKNGKWGYETFEEAVKEAKANGKPLPSIDNYLNIAFVVMKTVGKNVEEDLINIDKIFAGDNNSDSNNNMLINHSADDKSFAKARAEMIKEIKEGIKNTGTKKEKRFLFLMADIHDLEAFADFVGVSPAAIIFINANDNFRSTLSPEYVSDGKDVPYGKQLNDQGKWVDDLVFSIKTKSNKENWFTDDIQLAKTELQKVNKDPLAKLRKENLDIEQKLRAANKQLEDDLMNKNPTAAGELQKANQEAEGKIKKANQEAEDEYVIKIDDLELTSASTKKKYYINVKAALENGGADLDFDEFKKYITDFRIWFIFTFLNSDSHGWNGNKDMHSVFDVSDLKGNGKFEILMRVKGRVDQDDMDKLLDILNNNNAVKEETFPNFKDKLILDKFLWKSGQDLLDFVQRMAKKQSGNYLFNINPIISVFNEKRLVDASQNRRHFTHAAVSAQRYAQSASYKLFSALGKTDISKQSLFQIFDSKEQWNMFILLDDNGNELKISGTPDDLKTTYKTDAEKKAAEDKALLEWQDIFKREFPAAKEVPETILTIKNKLVESIFKKATKVKINVNYHGFYFSKEKIAFGNLNKLVAKPQPLEKMLELMYFDLNEAESARANISNKKVSYIAPSGKVLKEWFTNYKDGSDEANELKLAVYYYLFNGFIDIVFNAKNIEKLLVLYNGLENNGLQITFIQNLLGKNLERFLDDNKKTIDPAKVKDFVDFLNNLDKSKIHTGWQRETVHTLALAQFLLSPLVHKLDDFEVQYLSDILDNYSKIVIPPRKQTIAPVSKWIDDAWEGYQSALKGIYSDYVNLFNELITRDLLQITHAPNQDSDDEDKEFRYGSDYTNIVEGVGGYELYLNMKKIFDKNSRYSKFKEEHELAKVKDKPSKPLFFETVERVYESIKSQATTSEVDVTLWSKLFPLHKDIGNRTFEGSFEGSGDWFLSVFGTRKSANGFYLDRWYRDVLRDKRQGAHKSWVLYDDDANPVVDTEIKTKKPVIDPQTQKIKFEQLQGLEQNRPYAYWWWLLSSYGVGNRTVTGMYRVPERNSIAMWGYLQTSVAKKVKFIKAEKDGEVVYIPIKTEGTNNLFYLRKQGDMTSKHVLAKDGFMSWSVDLLAVGPWYNATLTDGEWKLTFVDENKESVIDPTSGKNAFTLGRDAESPGHVEWLTENNKDKSYAPLVMATNDAGEVILILKSEFMN